MGFFGMPGVGDPKPWFFRDPIILSEKDLAGLAGTLPMIEIDPNWKPPETGYAQEFLSPEEKEQRQEQWHSKFLLKSMIRSYNADFLKDLPEDQQWAFLNTMNSIKSSMLTMSNLTQGDHGIFGALYGQNLAKIEYTSKVMGGKYADKLKEALDWYAGRAMNESQSLPVHMDNPKFQHFSKLFSKLGNCSNANDFKCSLQESLTELSSTINPRYQPWMHVNGKWTQLNAEGSWTFYSSMLTDDWDEYFSNLMFNNEGLSHLSSYMLKYDVTA